MYYSLRIVAAGVCNFLQRSPYAAVGISAWPDQGLIREYVRIMAAGRARVAGVIKSNPSRSNRPFENLMDFLKAANTTVSTMRVCCRSK